MYSILLSRMSQRIHRSFKMIKSYMSRQDSGESAMPFPPVARFWEIQRAFAAADVAFLKILLESDFVASSTYNLEPKPLRLSNISHEVVFNNSTEFSVHYTFTDSGNIVDQVWHYKLYDSDWKLTSIETASYQ